MKKLTLAGVRRLIKRKGSMDHIPEGELPRKIQARTVFISPQPLPIGKFYPDAVRE